MTAISRIKEFPIPDLLARLGHQPVRQSGGELLYHSPLRDDRDPSFSVNPAKGLWIDYGTGEGGDILTLIMQLEKLESIREAISRIDAIFGQPQITDPIRPVLVKNQPSTPTEIVSTGPIKAPSLVAYLKSRGIDPVVCGDFLEEVHYLHGDRKFFAIGFKNDVSGYELRTSKTKRSLGNKAVTTIEGYGGQLNLYEGFFDFLSSVSMLGHPPSGSSIVLNSAGMKRHALLWIQEQRPSVINLYFDADNAGRELADYFREQLPDTTVVDFSSLYAGQYNDLNEWHVARMRQRSPTRSR